MKRSVSSWSRGRPEIDSNKDFEFTHPLWSQSTEDSDVDSHRRDVTETAKHVRSDEVGAWRKCGGCFCLQILEVEISDELIGDDLGG